MVNTVKVINGSSTPYPGLNGSHLKKNGTMVEVDRKAVELDAPFRAIVHSSYYNEGTAIPTRTRSNLGIEGLLPPSVENLELQKKRALVQFRSKATPLEKYIFLAWLRNTNIRLFYRIVNDELEEVAPIIYTPTVGTACLEYSNIYPFLAPPGVPDGLFLTLSDLPDLHSVIRNYRPVPSDPTITPQIAVITDGSRILGLGDLGANGMGIPIGKLQLYVACAGIDPRRTLPITLDLGTNNEKLLNDEFYLGLKQRRPADDVFYSTVDTVLRALYDVYPDLLVQFEDWSSEHAFALLERYQNKTFCFNDDIQGTGAVVLSGFMNAVRIVQNVDGIHPKDHRIVFFGAGSAGVGVAKQLMDYFVHEHGMKVEEAKKRFWFVDSRGLVTLDRGDRLAKHKVFFARDDNQGQQIKGLLDILNYVKPTCLIGLSAQRGAFNSQILNRMAELNKRPIIFSLSNPATSTECSFEDAMIHTGTRAIYASGTAFPSYLDPKTGEEKVPAQGNNMYIFPGLGLGAILASPKFITDRMIYEAASTLSKTLTPEERSQERLYPTLKRIRHVSAQVAAAVCVEAINQGLARNKEVVDIFEKERNFEALVELAKNSMWSPDMDEYGAEKIVVEKSKM